ncbi:hypothetical protein CEXT_357841 [Caerostris extrusa]|uniref:Uncharacterized protein n=1 Tax=Caerostris extrusa TaxID=172846 RepID=A0AAV4XX43_CAEEX|nr:hypothetical protein CEXT_357841 [Caerostris extrusa]
MVFVGFSYSIFLPYHCSLVQRQNTGFETLSGGSVFYPEVISCPLESIEKFQHYFVSTCSQWLQLNDNEAHRFMEVQFGYKREMAPALFGLGGADQEVGAEITWRSSLLPNEAERL